MNKTPEIRIKVPDVDRLLLLTEAQLKVWLWYKRREGRDKRAFGKAGTIAEACGLRPGTVRNARSRLVRDGWLARKLEPGKPLPLFLAVIPELHRQAGEVSFPNDVGVIPELQGVSSESEAQVVSVQEASNKDSATDVAVVSESVSECAPAAPSPSALSVLRHIYPAIQPTLSDADTKTLNAKARAHGDWDGFFAWHTTHKPANLQYHGRLPKFLEGVDYSLNDYALHDPKRCAVCRRLRTKGAKPGTHAYLNPELHTGLDGNGRSWAEGKVRFCGTPGCKIGLHSSGVPCDVEAEAVSVGKGLDLSEEDE